MYAHIARDVSTHINKVNVCCVMAHCLHAVTQRVSSCEAMQISEHMEVAQLCMCVTHNTRQLA
jgi:hypothetical protein